MMATEDLRDTSWLVVGCGYTGERLLRALVDRGARARGVRRDPSGAPGDLPIEAGEKSALQGRITRGDIVVDLAPPEPGAAGRAERELAEAAAAAGATRIVYVSSTGVYAAAGGEWVDEEFPLAPLGDRGAARIAAETALFVAADAAGLSAVVLRPAGIYGPGRGVHVRMRRGEYRVIGAGSSAVSRVHVDDLVAAILAAGTAELRSRVFNVADEQPTSSREHADGVARRLGLSVAPSVDPSQVSERARAMLTADRRIDSRRLRDELGVALAYPTWAEGLEQCLEEEAGATDRSSEG